MAIKIISATTPPKTKQIGNATIYLEPRMSANQLAQFLVSDPAKQESIVKTAKKVVAVHVANYVPARSAMPKCHVPTGLDPQAIIRHAERMETTSFPLPFDRQSNDLSAAAFRRAAPLVAQIDCAGQRVGAPSRGFDHLVIEGVRVSIQPEIVFSFAHRGAIRFGGVMFTFSKTDSSSLLNTNGRYSAGEYASFLVFLMLSVHFASKGGPRNANCYAVDVYRDQVFACPASSKTMSKNIEAACRNITRQWDSHSDTAGAADDLDLF